MFPLGCSHFSVFVYWLFSFCVFVQGSPFILNVKKKFRRHSGKFHCCCFCSSGGAKEARCGCPGTMPGTQCVPVRQTIWKLNLFACPYRMCRIILWNSSWAIINTSKTISLWNTNKWSRGVVSVQRPMWGFLCGAAHRICSNLCVQ